MNIFYEILEPDEFEVVVKYWRPNVWWLHEIQEPKSSHSKLFWHNLNCGDYSFGPKDEYHWYYVYHNKIMFSFMFFVWDFYPEHEINY